MHGSTDSSLGSARARRDAERRHVESAATEARLSVLPAFRDIETGETHLSINADGTLAPVHVLEGLPEHWVLSRGARGEVRAIKDSVIAGFLRGGRFYSHEEMAAKGYDA